MPNVTIPTFLTGLEFQKCLRKIQLLTLVSLATENTEVEFKCLCSELDLELESVEPTVIEGRPN